MSVSQWCEFPGCDAEARFLVHGSSYCLLHTQVIHAQEEAESDD